MSKTLLLTVFDEDRFGSDFIGETRVMLKRLPVSREKMFSVFLDKQLPVKVLNLPSYQTGWYKLEVYVCLTLAIPTVYPQ